MVFYKTNKFLLSLLLCFPVVFASGKEYVNIDDKWKFYPGTLSNGQSMSVNDKSWTDVNIPHTWNAIDGQNGGGDYRRGDGWYRKAVTIPSTAKGKRVYIDFGAACMTTEVYVNDTLVGKHIGGYGRFVFDITKYVTPGRKNVIAIKVSNRDVIAPPRHADFTFSGGVQRDIRLIIANNLHIAPVSYIAKNAFLVIDGADIASSGVKVRQYDVSDASAKVDVTTTVRNSNVKADNASVEVAVYDRNGNKITDASKSYSIMGNSEENITSTLTISNPHLWNGVIDPYLYKVVVVLKENAKEVDHSVEPLGLRYFGVSKTDGFMLNGKSYPLRGFAAHDEHMDKGRAITDADRLRDLEIIRNSGANYIRMSHYQHGDYEYDYCDSVGIICWTEIPCIDFMSSPSQQATFQYNTATQLYELIRQQYNHPSVCFWGLCNEIRRESPGSDVPAVISALNNLAHKEDDTRLTTLAHDKADIKQIKEFGEWQIPDVIAVNKYVGWYEGNRNDIAAVFEKKLTAVNNTSSKSIAMSEYGAGGSPFIHNVSDVGGGATGNEEHPEEFQAYSHEQVWSVIEKSKWFWSTACWAAFDFASDGRKEGDEAGINDKGIVTHDRGIKKDAYFVYQASLAERGVVHIKSRRFVNPGNPMTVKAYSNCENLKVRVNGGAWQDMISTNPSVCLYACDGVKLSDGANVVEVMGKYGNDIIVDKAVWYVGKAPVASFAEKPGKAKFSIIYNAPVDGTYTMRVWYKADSQHRVDVSANGYTTTHYFASSDGYASSRRAVVLNVYLKKGVNIINFISPEGVTPDVDDVNFYFYHVGSPDFEDNDIQKLVPIPNNPNKKI